MPSRGARPPNLTVVSKVLGRAEVPAADRFDPAEGADAAYRKRLLLTVMAAVMGFGSLMTIVTVSLSVIATDLGTSRTTLGAIRAAGAQILIPMTSGPVAIPVYRQIGELQIPVAVTGVNVEAEGAKFWEATGGSAAYLGVNLTSSSAAFTKEKPPWFFSRA